MVLCVRVLIDTWWNVNHQVYNPVFFLFSVLIDTWWNVNSSSGYRSETWVFVLIDTWWNVNWNQVVPDEYVIGFNRYMVECEFNN